MKWLGLGSVCVLLLAASAGTPSENAPPSNDAVRRFALESLRRSIIHGLSIPVEARRIDPPADPAGLILLLAEIDSKGARRLLVEMLELRMGEADAEALFSAVTSQGRAIEPMLRQALGQPVRCDIIRGTQKIQRTPLACSTPEERDRTVLHLIDLIEKGQKIEYVL
jgi:hypothetical protein